jgi:hypothetical protein
MRTTATTSQTGMMFWNSGTGEVQSISVAKTFVIDHPKKKENYLVHACLEGPEIGVYYRGKGTIENNSVEIELPDYVDVLATEFTVHLTPIGGFAKLYASEVENGTFTVFRHDKSINPVKFHWVVYARRGSIEVDPLKSTTTVKGDGPYRWI